MRIREIVVGTDGTPPGGAAVEWAAREAAHRRARLRVVHVGEPVAEDDCAQGDLGRHLAEAVANDAARGARTISPAIDVLAEVATGDPALCLLHAAEYADLLVVGSRARTGLAGLLSDRVGRHLIARSPCPVVVVHGRGDRPGGPVVAGVDIAESADQVLDAAFAAAADRDAELVVAHTYLPVAPFWGIDLPSSATAGPDEDAVEHAQIEDTVARWRGKYPHVPVRTVIRPGGPGSLLARLSGDARLVVVGNRGLSVVAGALLGSTGTYLMHHAECPVWVVRSRTASRDHRP